MSIISIFLLIYLLHFVWKLDDEEVAKLRDIQKLTDEAIKETLGKFGKKYHL